MSIFFHKVEIVNKQGRYCIGLREKLIIKRAVSSALAYEGIFPAYLPAFVSVSLVNDKKIRKINFAQRSIDRSTDVLSFPLLDFTVSLSSQFDSVTGYLPLGDIVISMDHVYKQAQLYGHSFERELAFLCVHSVLHLLGYDHVTLSLIHI